MDGSAALTLYRQEKERALQERRISHAQLMAEAKEAFAKMLADAQLARKGGRPKSNPNAPPTAQAAAAAKPKVVAAPPAKRRTPEEQPQRSADCAGCRSRKAKGRCGASCQKGDARESRRSESAPSRRRKTEGSTGEEVGAS